MWNITNFRLNLQHKLWIDIFGYLLHPDIPISKPDLKLADIGTGTGLVQGKQKGAFQSTWLRLPCLMIK